MNEPNRRPSPNIPPAQRVLLVAAGCALAAALAVAASLSPDPRGYGTHQQLGLPPCWMVRFFGVRCPSCGMTTAWARLARGQLTLALRANAGGVLLAAAAMAAIPWSLLSGLRGRWLGRPGPRSMLALLAAIAAVTLLDWGLRAAQLW